jgi:hypothetical protein
MYEKYRPVVEGENEVSVLKCDPEQTGLDYQLSYGSKIVGICLFETKTSLSANSMVQNTGEDSERIASETTTLYGKVREILQQVAEEKRKPLLYRFTTEYPQMANWALSKGAEVFDWDTISKLEDFGENGELLRPSNTFNAEKNFYPKPDNAV